MMTFQAHSTQRCITTKRWVFSMESKLYFTLLLLWRNKKQHLAVFLISTLLIFTLASMLLLSSSLKHTLQEQLSEQAEFTIQAFQAGRVQFTPQKWVDEFLNIKGVSDAKGRIYGMHYYEPKEQYFMIVGIDPYEPQTQKSLQKLIDSLDVEKFLAKNSMIIGQGVKDFFDAYHYFHSYTFRPPDRSKVKVFIYDVLPNGSELFGNDLIFMPKELARKILGIPDGFVSDITLSVANPKEMQNIYEKLIIAHFNTRIITKKDIEKLYTELFNYKSGFFITLFLLSLLSFMLILYERYSLVKNSAVIQIALFRSVGWRVESLISLKLFENLIIVLFAYLLGFILAYIFIFYLDAPLLKNIFLGSANLTNASSFHPYIDASSLLLLFFLFVTPFLLAIVIPLWKLCSKPISETLR